MFALLLPGKSSIASFLQLVARLGAETCGSHATRSDNNLYCACLCEVVSLCVCAATWRYTLFKRCESYSPVWESAEGDEILTWGGGGPRTLFVHSLSASPGCQIVNRGGRKRSLSYLMQVVITRLFRSVSKVSLPKSELPECCFVSLCHGGWYWLMSKCNWGLRRLSRFHEVHSHLRVFTGHHTYCTVQRLVVPSSSHRQRPSGHSLASASTKDHNCCGAVSSLH